MAPRIAIFGDVHGNLPALEAVLEDLDMQRPDEVLVAGDLVGRGPAGTDVVRAIAARGWSTIRGNHEDYLLAFRRGEIPEDWRHEESWSAARWMAAELTEDAAAFIGNLPLGIHSTLEPDLKLVHGTPRSHSEGIGPWTGDAELAGYLQAAGTGLLVCAHTHRPLVRDLPTGRVVNVGAVGLPFNRDRRAQYALLQRAPSGAWTVEFRQVEYDLSATLRLYETSGFLAAGGITARLLRRELECARPFLVPFLMWADSLDRPRELSQLDAFLSSYDPEAPMGTFLDSLQDAAGSRRQSGPS